MAFMLTTDTDLKAVADAIREKAGTQGDLEYPDGFVSAIGDLQKGTPKAADTYYTSGSDRSIAANTFLEGAQTIKGVTTSNLSAGNIKAGVTVKVGDDGNAGRIANVSGTFTSDANADASDVVSGKTYYRNGSKYTGTAPTKGAETIDPRNGRRTISGGTHLTGTQTIYGVSMTSETKSAGTFPASRTPNGWDMEAGKYYDLGSLTLPSGWVFDHVELNSSDGAGEPAGVYLYISGSTMKFRYCSAARQQIPANKFKAIIRRYYTTTV